MKSIVPAGNEVMIEAILEALPPEALRRERRFILGIAGPPAAGKSTLAEALRETLNRYHPDNGEVAAIVALDGFHYDDRVLLAQGHRHRKGAPCTFDADGYAAMIDRLAAPSRQAVAIPVFDRGLELSRAAASLVEPHHHVVIAEGNYLLLDDERWRGLRDRIDLCVFLDVPANELRSRLMARWLGLGYGPEEAREKTEANDLVNARLVMTRSTEPDLRLRPTG